MTTRDRPGTTREPHRLTAPRCAAPRPSTSGALLLGIVVVMPTGSLACTSLRSKAPKTSAPALEVSREEPERGPSRTLVTLRGTGFESGELVELAVDGAPASVVRPVSIGPTLLRFQIPAIKVANDSRVRVSVLRGRERSRGTNFTLTPGRAFFVSPRAPIGGDGSLERPFLSITSAAAVMQPGDVAWLREGTYGGAQRIRCSGTPERPIEFRSLPGENVLLVGADAHPNERLTTLTVFGSDVIVDGMHVSNANGPGSGIWIAGRPWVETDAMRVRISNMEIFGAKGQGILISGTDTIIERSSVHDNGAVRAQEHGIYVEGTRAIVRQNAVYANFGYGIHVWSGTRNDHGQHTIESNLVYENGFGCLRSGSAETTAGIVVGAHQPHSVVRHNVVCGNAQYGILVLDHPLGTQVLENVTCHNRLGGVFLRDPGVDTTVEGSISYDDHGFALALNSNVARSDHNIYFSEEGAPRIVLRGQSFSLAPFQRASGLDTESREIDPGFKSPPRGTFEPSLANSYDFCSAVRPFLCR